MNKKNPSKNGFYFYKLEFEKNNKGKIFNKGITDIAVAALDSWTRMTLQQREPFEDLAKSQKADKPKMVKPHKDSSSDTNNRCYVEKVKAVNEMVTQSSLNTIVTRQYYFIAANVFCETMLKKYYPAEVALIKFTLKDGVMESFHTYINPEIIPMGYRFDAIHLSNETHQLPIPPNAKGEKNYASVLGEIDKFTGKASELITLFTLEQNMPMIESIIHEFCLAANCTTCRYDILSVNQLFFDLKNRASVASRFKSIDDATNREKFMYLNQIACQFHEENDCSKYCCLAAVKRWAYAISENICTDLNITPVAGKHLPIQVDGPLQQVQKASTDKELIFATTTATRSNKSDYFNEEFDLNANYELNSDTWAHTMNYSFGKMDLNSTTTTDFSELDRLREGCHLSVNIGSTLLSNNRGRRGRNSFGRGRIGCDGNGQKENGQGCVSKNTLL